LGHGKRGRGARGKTAAFGIYRHNGRVHTEAVPDCKKAGLRAIIRGKVESAATTHTVGSRPYDGIVHMG
jgi:transposase